MIENQLFIEREKIFGETEYLYKIITHNLQILISFNTIKYEFKFEELRVKNFKNLIHSR